MTTKKTTFAPGPAKSAGYGEKITMKKIAELLSVSRKTLEGWRDQGCPGLPPASVDVEAIKSWAKSQGKRAGEEGGMNFRQEKLLEEIRKLRLANDQKAGRLVERAWVAGRIQAMFGDINAFRSRSEAEHATRFAAAAGDVALCRTHIRGIWDQILTDLQSLHKHLEEG